MNITSTVGAWRVIELDIYDEQLRNHGVFYGAIQDVALALAGKIGAESRLEFQQFMPPKQVSPGDITGVTVKIKVDGMDLYDVQTLINADIDVWALDMTATLDMPNKLVILNAGLTEESSAQLQQLAIANKALASLTQEQRDAIMATRMLCPVVPAGGA